MGQKYEIGLKEEKLVLNFNEIQKKFEKVVREIEKQIYTEKRGHQNYI